MYIVCLTERFLCSCQWLEWWLNLPNTFFICILCVYPAMKQWVSVQNSLCNSLIMALIKNFWHFTWLKLHAPLYSHTCSLGWIILFLPANQAGWHLNHTENPWLRWYCPFLISATGDVLNIQDLIHFFYKASWSVTLETTA